MAQARHKRDTDARRLLTAKTACAGLAVMTTVPVVALGVLTSGSPTGLLEAAPAAASLTTTKPFVAPDRVDVVSRSASRKAAKAANAADRAAERAVRALVSDAATSEAVLTAETKRWTTAELNLWTGPGDAAIQAGEIPASRQVLVTGRTSADRVEIVVDGASRWVTSGYLSEDKPVGAAAGLSMAPCPNPGVERGLTARAVYVYRSVCHAFPQITRYGGWDNHGEHASGRALDIMTSDVALGTAIAEFLRSHSAELHLYDILWRQRIWTPVRAAEGWRMLSNRGSATANHYDHVHVSVY